MSRFAVALDCTVLLLTAAAMNEAALDGEFDELRFLAHVMLTEYPSVAPEAKELGEALILLIRALGPNGTRPSRSYAVALNELTEAVQVACQDTGPAALVRFPG